MKPWKVSRPGRNYRSEIHLSKKIAELDVILRNLEQNCDLIDTALVSDKGRMMCSSLPEGSEEKAVAAMAAAILSIGSRVGMELGVGVLKSTLIDGNKKSVVLKDIGGILLVGIAPPESEIGLVDYEVNKAAEKVQALFRL